MESNKLLIDIIDYVLSDNIELDDFILNFCETEEEENIIKNQDGLIKISEERRKILKKGCSHIYAKCCFAYEKLS